MLITAQLSEPSSGAPHGAGFSPLAAGQEILQPEPFHSASGTAASHAMPAASGEPSGNPTDRLSAFFQELVETALRDRVMGVVQRISERMESRVQQIEADAVSRVEQRVQAAADAQGQLMERRTSDFVGSQQVALEQNVQQFLESSETGMRQRQQDFLEQSRQAMRDEMTALLDSSNTSLEKQAADLVSVTQQALRFSMEQQLPGIEKDLLERCRQEAERMMAGQVEQWTLLLNDRVQEARQSILTQMDQTAAEAGQRYAAALETRTEQGLDQAGARLEQQLARIGTQVRQSFLRHIVGELSRSQQIWIQQAQRQLESVAAHNLQWTRQSVAQIMKNFGEAMIRQAYLEGGTPPEVAPIAPHSEAQAANPAAQHPADWTSDQPAESTANIPTSPSIPTPGA